jgi:hypothetical protein
VNVDQFVKKCSYDVPRAIETSTRTGVNAGAAVLATAATATLAAATHGSLILHGVPQAKLGVKVLPATSIVNPTALVSDTPAGLGTILNAGTFPHVVGSGRGKVSTGTNKYGVKFAKTAKGGNSHTTKLLTFGKGNGAAYGPFIAGGSPAHETLARAAGIAQPAITRAVQAESTKSIFRAFK